LEGDFCCYGTRAAAILALPGPLAAPLVLSAGVMELNTNLSIKSFLGSSILLQYSLALVLFRVQLGLMIVANCQKEYLVKFQKKKSIWHLTDVCICCLSTELTDLSSQMFVFDQSMASCHSFTS